MELFIRLVDGQPVDHPILGDNFREAFPQIDTDNLPPEFARFNRIPQPDDLVVGLFQVPTVSYVWAGSAVEDSWSVRDMTEEEKAEKTEQARAGIESALSQLKQIAEDGLAAAINSQEESMWRDYMNALTAFSYTDPFAAVIPRAPYKNSDGVWMTTTASGSAPDVIG